MDFRLTGSGGVGEIDEEPKERGRMTTRVKLLPRGEKEGDEFKMRVSLEIEIDVRDREDAVSMGKILAAALMLKQHDGVVQDLWEELGSTPN